MRPAIKSSWVSKIPIEIWAAIVTGIFGILAVCVPIYLNNTKPAAAAVPTAASQAAALNPGSPTFTPGVSTAARPAFATKTVQRASTFTPDGSALTTPAVTGTPAVSEATDAPSACPHPQYYAKNNVELTEDLSSQESKKITVRTGSTLECLASANDEIMSTPNYLLKAPDGKQGWINSGDSALVVDDPRTCFNLHADNFPVSTGYLYSWWELYGHSSQTLESIPIADILGGKVLVPMAEIQTIEISPKQSAVIHTADTTYVLPYRELYGSQSTPTTDPNEYKFDWDGLRMVILNKNATQYAILGYDSFADSSTIQNKIVLEKIPCP